MCNEENIIYIYRGYEIKKINDLFVINNKDVKDVCAHTLDSLEEYIDNHLKELDHQDKVLTNFNKKQRKKISKVFVRGGND